MPDRVVGQGPPRSLADKPTGLPTSVAARDTDGRNNPDTEEVARSGRSGPEACHAGYDADTACADRNTRRRDGGRRSYGPAQPASHHRTAGLAPGGDLEAVPGEGRRDPGKQGAGMTRHGGVHRAGLQRGRASRGGQRRPGSRLPSPRGDGRHGARTSTGSTTPAGHRPASGTGPASARPARRAGPARTSRRPARRQRSAGPAAARTRRAGRGHARYLRAAGHGSAGRCASTCTSTRSRRPPGG